MLTDTGRTGKAGGHQDGHSLLWLLSELSSEELPGLLLVGLDTSSGADLKMGEAVAELWLPLSKEDLASWARQVPAGAGPARWPGLRRSVAGRAPPASVLGTASPDGQSGAPMSSTWGASELWSQGGDNIPAPDITGQPDRVGGRPLRASHG